MFSSKHNCYIQELESLEVHSPFKIERYLDNSLNMSIVHFLAILTFEKHHIMFYF